MDDPTGEPNSPAESNPPIDEKLEALLQQELAAPRDSEERVMQSIAVRLNPRTAGKATRQTKQNPTARIGDRSHLRQQLVIMAALIAGVLLFLAIDRLPPKPAKLAGGGAGAEGAHDPKEGQDPPSPASVPLEERLVALSDGEVQACIHDLEAGNDAARAGAIERLALATQRARLLVSDRMAQLKAADRAQFQRALDAMKQTDAELQRSIDAAVAEAPARFLPANPDAVRKLEKKVTFDFVDTDLTTAVDFCAQISGEHMVIDKTVAAHTPPTISLRVTDMTVGLALDWISKLDNLSYVVRGKVVVFTTPERADKLLQEQRLYAVPPPPGEAAYSVEELKQVAALANFNADEPQPPIRVTLEGELRVSSKHAAVAKLIGALGGATQKPDDAEAWVRDIDARLQRKVTFKFEDQSFEDAVNFLNSLSKVNIIIDPRIAAKGMTKTPITLNVNERSLADALTQMCQIADVTADYRNQAVFISDHSQLARNLCVIDLGPALKAGVRQAELEPALTALLAGSPFKYPAPLFLRTRMIAEIDEWTARSVQAVIDGAAATKKIPAAPADPWFFKTFSPAAPAPAKPDAGALRR